MSPYTLRLGGHLVCDHDSRWIVGKQSSFEVVSIGLGGHGE